MSSQLPNIIATGALLVPAIIGFYTIRRLMRKDRAEEITKAEARGRELERNEQRMRELEQANRELQPRNQPGGQP
jgi:hypothetical protein